MAVTDLLKAYAKRIRDLRSANPAVSEPALAPAFQQLLEAMLPVTPLAPDLTIVPEFNSPGVGRPDIALAGAGAPAAPPRGFVELKSPDKPDDPKKWKGHDRRQFERFEALGNWATCNFTHIRLFERGTPVDYAEILPAAAIDPFVADNAADKLIDGHDSASFQRLLQALFIGAGKNPSARDAEHLAELLAYSARLVRAIVQDRLKELHHSGPATHALLQVRREFREVLYAHPEAGGYSNADFDLLFSAAFAQTLAFGLLLVREGSGGDVDAHAWENMPDEHPLMKTTLRVLSQPEVRDDIGIGFQVMRDTVNSFDPALLAIGPDGRDPILYFYEHFLATFDPAARERYGVYYTPVEVVRFMVGALDRALSANLGTQGLSDPSVTILDPATGTGTFLLGVADRVRQQAVDNAGAGMEELALTDLAGRMFGLELLIGPYAVAHYRLHHALRQPLGGAAARPITLPRLGVYLADTLAEPGAAAAGGQLGVWANPIRDERDEANRIKENQPILAIIGNPPYRRLEEGENRTLVGRWMDDLWDDLKAPVRDAKQGNQLNTFPELSVAFWRWAIWKLFEAPNAPNRGVIAFISNRKYLTGWPYAGLRRMMRQRFDRIEVYDLRGDVRRGGRAGVSGDQGVFDIQVGTAITLAIADGSKPPGAMAEILYHDSWEESLFNRRAKLDWLLSGTDRGELPNAVPVVRGPLEDMRAAPFLNGELLSLAECFEFRRSGVQTKRDNLVYSANRQHLSSQISEFLQADDASAKRIFHDSRDRIYRDALAVKFDHSRITPVSYRPLDQRFLYNHRNYGDLLRPELQEVWGDENICLYAMPGGTGAGPAVWCHGLLPDYHAFRGSYGGYAFPLYDRQPASAGHNLSRKLIEGLGAAYGTAVSAEEVFDAMLCLLSASSYTLRFAEDLEDVFPHVPLPADHDVFRRAAGLGAEIRAVETFARPPGGAFLTPEIARVATAPAGNVDAGGPEDGAIVLCGDGSGRIEGVPQPVWDFAVSGYPVARRWLKGRAGLPADYAIVSEFRDICGRILELIDLFERADTLLDETLQQPLIRDTLGFGKGSGDA